MSDSKDFKFDNSVILVPFIVVFTIWFVFWLDLKFNFNFNKYGILPRTVKGLRGIVFSPFLHSGTSHLINNSIPLVVLISGLLYFYKKIALKVLVYGTIFTGILTWIIGRESYHIGASGIVYLLFSFIFFSGIIRKHYRLIAFSLVIIFLYGSMMWYVFPIKEGISWEGHLSGFIIGLLLSVFYRRIGPQKPIYVFKQTEFDNHFDENGNFIEKNDLNGEEISDK